MSLPAFVAVAVQNVPATYSRRLVQVQQALLDLCFERENHTQTTLCTGHISLPKHKE
eukprot:m.102422 g.102422  ORF g.102422 m.102422 type:complete len:57 (-) comp13220_c0_seq2:530-700(-)